MKGLNHFQYYFIPVTNQSITEEAIQYILRYIVELPEDVAKYDTNEQIITFQFDGQQYITLYDYFQLLKDKKFPFDFKILIEITIKIFDSLLQYNQNKLEVDLSFENIWIFFGKTQNLQEQSQNLKVYLIQAQCFEAQEKIIVKDQLCEFRIKLNKELQNLQSQYKIKNIWEEFISAINSQNVQTAKAQLQEIQKKIKEHPNTEYVSFEMEIINLKQLLYSIFDYGTKLASILRDNLMNWIIKDKSSLGCLFCNQFIDFFIMLKLQEIIKLLEYLRLNRIDNLDENVVVLYLCKGKFLNSLQNLRTFKFQDLKQYLDQENQIKKQFDQVNHLLSYFQKYYPNLSQQLQQQNPDYLQNLKLISDKTIEMINQKINLRIQQFFKEITKFYKMNQEQFEKWYDQNQKNKIFEQTMQLIEQNLLNKQIQFQKLNAAEDLINNFIEQSMENITMQLIMKKNEGIVNDLHYPEKQQNKMEVDQF